MFVFGDILREVSEHSTVIMMEVKEKNGERELVTKRNQLFALQKAEGGS